MWLIFSITRPFGEEKKKNDIMPNHTPVMLYHHLSTVAQKHQHSTLLSFCEANNTASYLLGRQLQPFSRESFTSKGMFNVALAFEFLIGSEKESQLVRR